MYAVSADLRAPTRNRAIHNRRAAGSYRDRLCAELVQPRRPHVFARPARMRQARHRFRAVTLGDNKVAQLGALFG